MPKQAQLEQPPDYIEKAVKEFEGIAAWGLW